MVGASIEPCPWLNYERGEDILPYYLWDRQMRKTVETRELEDSPDYIAVSHTWGRWKIDGPPAQLPGAPWPIPCNMRFRVMDLPDILAAVPLPHRYIWMDLVCIPQDGSELSKREISRQATIFREASCAIMWLNNIERWEHLPAVLKWLCAKFISQNEVSYSSVGMIANVLQAHEGTACIELLESGSETWRLHSKAGFNPWFTSLWTLQEICIRPDMIVANRDWEFLSLSDRPVLFDEIVALEHSERKADGLERPPVVSQLGSLLAYTGLSGLATMTRSTIIGLGSARFCLERRAEAIMSAIDATEWFSICSGIERDKEFILGQYPLRFVQEVRSKLGSHVFFWSSSMEPFFWNAVLDFEDEYKPVGSMLPFGLGAPKSYHPMFFEPIHHHSSVDTWVLEPTGCVRIAQAAIVSSNAMSTNHEMMSTLFAPVSGSDVRVPMPHRLNLHDWVKTYQPWAANYAIALFVTHCGSGGILLKELRPGILVKVGTYLEDHTSEPMLPLLESVDWLVL